MKSARDAHPGSRLAAAEPGDWLEVHYIGGGALRRGQIVEVLGPPERPHFRVKWTEASETLHYPSEGDRLFPRDEILSP
jgi:hypothetical protein